MEIVKKLPEELKQYVLTFTYEFQPSFLLDDIRHYVRSRPTIQDWYINRFAWEYPNAENDWLYNDLIGFCNQDHALMFGYREYYFEIFSRIFLLKNKTRDELLPYCNIFRYTAKTSSIIWGIFTIEERTKFMENYDISTL